MFSLPWLASVRSLFSRRHSLLGNVGGRAERRREMPNRNLHDLERLETRRVLAFDFVSMFPSAGDLVADGATLREAPQQLTIKFSPGVTIDPATLGGIAIARSGGAGDPFGDGDDVTIVPGSITVDDIPNQNQVTIRFAETLIDDDYRVTITDELQSRPPLNGSAESFGSDTAAYSFSLSFRLDLGAQVVSVVPQPISRPKTIAIDADTSRLADGDLLSIAIRGGTIDFEFDRDGLVSSGRTSVSIGSKTSSQLASEIAAAVQAASAPGGDFVGELASATANGSQVTVAGSIFTPVVTFTRNGAVPTTPGAVISDSLPLSQHADTVVVHFNTNDLLQEGSAENPRNYQLFRLNETTGATINVIVPQSVSYDATTGTAVLSFASGQIQSDALYRLSIGGSLDNNATKDTAVAIGSIFIQAGGAPAFSTDTFIGDETASDVDLFKTSMAGPGTFTVTVTPVAGLDAAIRLFDSAGAEVTAGVTVTTNGAGLADTLSYTVGAAGEYFIGISSQANVAYSAIDGTGAVSGGAVGGYRLTVSSTVAVPTTDANSRFTTATSLGTMGIAGQTTSAAISNHPTITTPATSLLFPSQPGTLDEPGHRDIPVGIESHGVPNSFVGPASAIPTLQYNFRDDYGQDPFGNQLHNMITEAQKERAREIFELYSLYTGIRFVETASSGLIVATGDIRAVEESLPPTAVAGICDGGRAIMNQTTDWGQSEYGGGWFNVAMHEIGHALGLGHSYDIPSIQGNGLEGEAVFPGDYDIDHLLITYPKIGSDIDVYSFNVELSGTVSAETIVARPGQVAKSELDTVLTIYRETAGVRTLVARNDDYYGRDSFIELAVEPGTYYAVVTSTGNSSYNPEVADSGYGGRSQGAYDLRLAFRPAPLAANTIVDTGNTPLDGDRDGLAGGSYNFHFETASAVNTVFVDKVSTAVTPDGSLSNPFASIQSAVAAIAANTRILRIVGNDGNAATFDDDAVYQIGTDLLGTPLPDGASFDIPAGVTVMIDEAAIFKLRSAIVDVGSSSGLVSRANAAIQVLGSPSKRVRFTSYHDDSVGGNDDGVGPAAIGGQWGGIVLREDSDSPLSGVFLNSISQASIAYGGGNVFVDSQLQSFSPIHLENTRPTIAYNVITDSAGAAMSADPNSFLDADGRYGPEVRGNRLVDNSVNGLFIRIRTQFGNPVDTLDVPARLRSNDVVYVIQENLVINGGVGGYWRNPSTGLVEARESGRLAIDPGVVVKLLGSRIELERGIGRLIAEGTDARRIVFTSLADGRFGAGGTFDTNGNLPDAPRAGDWSGFMANAGAGVSLDTTYVGFGGGQSPIEGGFAQFNTFEVHQASLRVANSRIENNASGLDSSGRVGRGSNVAATVFSRGSQPILLANDFRDNLGSLVSINANAMIADQLPDTGRSIGAIGRFTQYDDNAGALIRDNLISYSIDNDTVDAVAISNGGAGYTSAPTVVLTAPGGSGVQATGIAVLGTGLQAGSVVAVIITNPGSGYGTTPPTVTFTNAPTDTTGGGAVGTALLGQRTSGGAIGGMEVRPEEITIESVWDDTDIVHVLRGEILVGNLHTATGLRLQSAVNESLIVKLQGATAGFTASGEGREIDDRIGGTVQIVGQPGYPVVLTSLRDDSIGASLDPLGLPTKDTNADGGSSAAAPSDWNRLLFLPLSNDTNIVFQREVEKPYTERLDSNRLPSTAQVLGVLAPNHPTGTNSTESAQEKSADENRRSGFEVAGAIAFDDPTDVDVYSFSGYAGSEVWIDVDKTSSSLDAMVELLDAAGNVLARSVDGIFDASGVTGERVNHAGGSATATYQLAGTFVLPGTLGGVVYRGNTAIQLFSVSRSGVFTFTDVGNPAIKASAASSAIDLTTGVVTLGFNADPGTTSIRDVGYEHGTISPTALGFTASGQNGGYILKKDDFRSNDFYSINPRDPGMRVILPGSVGTQAQYFIRVRSQPATTASMDRSAYETALQLPALVKSGQTSGLYELRVRLQQADQKAGSTVRYADIRFPQIGIDVQGLPRNSQLVGETGERPADNNGFASAQPVGPLLQRDQNTISIAGALSSSTDHDWYSFTIDYDQIQSIGGVNGGGKTWSTVFDIDYADGYRGDLTLSVFDDTGRLIYIGRDSNVTDDQPGTGQGTDTDDLARGSFGKLDPFIGPVQLPAGTPGSTTTYYVAVSSNARLPSALNATFTSAANNSFIRLEPVNSVTRVVEDHIGTVGYLSNGSPVLPTNGPLIGAENAIQLATHVRPFTLADVALYVSTGSSLHTVNALRGQTVTTLYSGLGGGAVGDIDMRPDGRLFRYFGANSDAGNNGLLQEISTGSGGQLSSVGDGIKDDAAGSTDNFWAITGQSVDALAIRQTGTGSYTNSIYYSIQDSGASILYNAQSSGSAAYVQNVWQGRMGPIMDAGSTLGITTGLQFRSETGSLYGVSDNGRFYQVATNSGLATNVVDFSAFLTSGGYGTGFQGLATAPVNLEGGAYAGWFFAITNTGRLVCINPVGAPANPRGTGGTGALVPNVFDTNNDGVADNVVSDAIGIGTPTGLAFSPLDINLWHPTTLRGADRGHGINGTADSNGNTISDYTRSAVNGNTSMYFGLEEWNSTSNFYGGFGGSSGQYGVATSGWQQELTNGSADTSAGAVGNNYNVPGGAHGSLITNPFSLAGYDRTDKPTLYFNYFLDSQNANAKDSGMRDAARVFISVDDGESWEVIATNNSSRSSLDTVDGELPNTLSASTSAGYAANQHVQELFDTANWRQARVDLDNWVGESNVRLRFDFSTAGRFDPNALRTSADLTRRASAVTASSTVTLAAGSGGTSGLRVGMAVAPDSLNFDWLSNAGQDNVLTIQSINPATNQITLSSQVTLLANAVLSFYDLGQDLDNDGLPDARELNNLDENRFGDLTSHSRGQSNAFEGFYIDDIIVGFAERGEMVTDATAGQVDFFSVATPVSDDYPMQALQGEYQLEIRRGTEYGSQQDPIQPDVTIGTTFDTNDRLIQFRPNDSLILEENAFDSIGGAVSTTGSNGSVSAITSLSGTSLKMNGNGLGGGIRQNVIRWSIDLSGQPSAFLQFDYQAGLRETFTRLPATFTVDATTPLPNGDGVAVSTDGGTNWQTVWGLGATNTGDVPLWSSATVDLISAIGPLSATTVIGFFQSGDRNGGAENGGMSIDDVKVFVNAPVSGTQSIGDSNHPRTQGQFIIENNFVSSAATVGINVDGGARDAGSNAPHPGSVRNLVVLNSSRLVAGVVVANNVVSSAGTTGIAFSGVPDGDQLPPSAVAFGRIINNTIYGGATRRGTGISVADNAGPTILNNLISNVVTAVSVDASSAPYTVVGTTAFHNVQNQVSGGVVASQSLVLPASSSPFVDPSTGNFYPAAGSLAIDSSLNTLQDRNAFVTVNSPLGIPQSPIIAPDRDIYGQLRGDDPSQASAPGLGSNVFKDRGAIDRVDFTQPTVSLLSPLDGTPIDRDSQANQVRLERADGRRITRFVLQLNDLGVGIDKNTVQSVDFLLDYTDANGVKTRQSDGTEYLFRFLESSNQVVLESVSVFPAGRYDITVTRTSVNDLAGNSVLNNNVAGAGTTAFVVTLADVPGIPGRPTSVPLTDGSFGDGRVTLNWQPPTNVGGSPITSYDIQHSTDGGLNWLPSTPISVSVAPFAPFTVTGLSNGTPYVFRIRGVNIVGAGEYSTVSLPVTPGTLPGTPTGLQGAFGNQQVTLTWAAPADDGDPNLTDYVVEYSVDGGANWLGFVDGVSSTTGAIVTGLVNGTSHLFRVKSVNIIGESAFTTIAQPIVPGVLPDAPTGLTATYNPTFPGQSSLAWSAPVQTGDPSLFDYVIERKVSGQADSTYVVLNDGVSVTPLTYVDAGLPKNLTYVYRVKARNVVGDSVYSATASVVVPPTPPSAPQSLVATNLAPTTFGVGRVNLAWNLPADDGGGTISDYVIHYRVSPNSDPNAGWSTFNDGISTTRSSVVTTVLTTGVPYEFRVAAVNQSGPGAFAVSNTVIPGVAPGRPTSLAGSPVANGVSLVWAAPTSAGDPLLSDYIVEYSPYGGTTFTVFNDGVGTTAAATVTGLTDGARYTFRVKARNSVGDSTYSAVTSAYAGVVPGAPSAPTATRGDGLATLTWLPPASVGSPALIDYYVEYRLSGATTWTRFADGTRSTTGATVTGLINGSSYEFQVKARNIVGEGAWSAPSSAVTIGVLPGAVTSLSASPQDRAVNLSWVAPANAGKPSLTDFRIEYKVNGQPDTAYVTFGVVSGSTTQASVGSLTNGTAYVFRVTALNVIGAGQPTTSTAATPRTTPGAVSTLAGVGGNGQVVLTWNAPSDNGGAVISDYVVERRLSSESDSAYVVVADGVRSQTGATVTGLMNGSSYLFRVRAVNEAGQSLLPVVSAEVMPGVAPGLPLNVAGAFLSSGTVRLTWTAPAAAGDPSLHDYIVEYKLATAPDSAFSAFADGVRSTTGADVTGLTNGASYVFRVKSRSTFADSGFSTTSPVVVMPNVPGAVRSLTSAIGPGVGQIRLSWLAPLSNGGRDVTDYVIQYRANGMAWTTFDDGVGTGTSVTVTSLQTGVSHEFRVAARNIVGEGSFTSLSTTITPIDIPSVPTITTVIGGGKAADVRWAAPSDAAARPVTKYIVQYKVNSASSKWVSVEVDGNRTSVQITNLTNRLGYRFRISAVNTVGQSAFSAETGRINTRV